MKFEEYISLRSAKKKFEEMSGFYNGDPTTNGEHALLKVLAPHVSLFLDIGYNEGDASTHMSKIKPGVRVLGFEPNPVLAKAAKHKIFMTALSDQVASDHPFHIHSNESGVSSLSKRTEYNPSFRAGFNEIKVAVSRLDDFIPEIDPSGGDLFMKVDVEGYEAKVIRGAKALFAKYKPVGYFEYANGWLEAGERFRDLFYHLDSIGYHCFRITPFGLEHLRFFHYIIENYVYQNIFFCPKGYMDSKLKHIDIPNDFSSTMFFPFA